MHRVAVLVLDDVVPLDFGIAYQVFGFARRADGNSLYAVDVCAPKRTIRTGGFDMRIGHGLEVLSQAETIVVPGSENPLKRVASSVIEALNEAHKRGARIASICTGAFTLAACGLLDGKRAATHWSAAEDLARLYPRVRVEPDVLFVDEGSIITSAGASAGLDTCLHLIRRDHGHSVAADAARRAVAPLHRDGGQAQFIRYEAPGSRTSLASFLDWLRDNLDGTHTVDTLAAHAGMSSRTFARRFQEQTGTTPLQWLISARVDHARALLEEGTASVDQIAFLAGFGSAVTFRARFRGTVGLTPTEYRHRFGARA